MKSNNIINILKSNNLVIPGFLLNNYKNFNITEKELIFLSSIITKEDLIIFNSEELAKNLNWNITDIMEVIYAILEYRGTSMEEVEQVRIKKRNRKGAFKNKIFLKDVEED